MVENTEGLRTGSYMNNSIRFKIIYLFTFAAGGAIGPLLGQYLESIGFSGTRIGTVTALGTAMAAVGSTCWGKVFSNAKDGRKVILMLSFMAAVLAVVNSMVGDFLVFTTLYAVLFFFQGPINGLNDAVVLEEKEEYAGIRLWGAIGYSISVFISGRIGEHFGLVNIFYIYALSYAIGGLMIMTVKTGRAAGGSEHEGKKEKIRYSNLFKEKKAIQLLICGAFVMGSTLSHNTYFGFLFRDGGGSVAGIGTVFLLMAGSEALVMPLAPWLSRKVGQERLILVAIVLAALRFGWYATGSSYQALIGTFFIQGIVNGILLVEYVKYISRIVNPRLIGIVMSAYYAVCSNGGLIVVNFVSGITMEYLGSTGVYALYCGMNVAAAVLFVLFGLHKSER